MKAKCVTAAVLAMAVVSPALARQDSPVPAGKYDAWVKEEVAYIISPEERDVFTQLASDRDRDAFIQEFWRQRDPTPGTPRNEFKDENDRRIDFANRRLRNGSSGPGRRSDRGRIYIKLGPPFDVRRYLSANTFPLELWHYRALPRLGDGSVLRLLFYQESGAGAYHLYHPASDRPRLLVPDPNMALKNIAKSGVTGSAGGSSALRVFPSQWDGEDRNSYLLLAGHGPTEVCEATYSVAPGTGSMSDQISASSGMLDHVEAYPWQGVRVGYAVDFLAHKPLGKINYSVFSMGNRSRVAVLEGASGEFAIHYLIVPESLTLENRENASFVNLRTRARLTDERGRTVRQEEKTYPIDLYKQELKALEGSSFQLDGVLPVAPGTYEFHLVLENTVSREFTTVKEKVAVPDPSALGMSPAILARRAERGDGTSAAAQPFRVDGFRIYPSADNTFRSGDKIFVFFQVRALSAGLRETGQIEISVTAGGSPVLPPRRRRIADAGGGPGFLEEIGAANLKPGTYAVKAAVLDRDGRELLSQNAPLTVTEAPVPRVWVVAQETRTPDGAKPVKEHGKSGS